MGTLVLAEAGLHLFTPDRVRERMQELNAGNQNVRFGADQDWPFDAVNGKLIRLKPLSDLEMRHYEYDSIARTNEYALRGYRLSFGQIK